MRNAKCILGYLTVTSPHHGHIGLAASPTRKKNNLRSLQQRNTLSMRISMFPVQYTLHWAGGGRAPLAPPDKLSRKMQARVDLKFNKSAKLITYSTFWGDYFF